MRFKYFIVFLAALQVSCKKHQDLFPGTLIGGHACAGLHISSSNYHDNSLEAYQYARSFEGVELVEVDVQLSKDGTFWLFHDPELGSESTGTGFIPQSDDIYLSGLNYKSLEKERVIRLQDLPADLKGAQLIFDLKELDASSNILVDSVVLMQALDQAGNYFFNGSLAVVTNTGRFIPMIKSLGFSVYYNSVNATTYLGYSTVGLTDGAVFRNSDIGVSDVNSVKLAGKKVIIYDVRSPKGIKSAFEKQPDYLLTDDIKATLIEKYQ